MEDNTQKTVKMAQQLRPSTLNILLALPPAGLSAEDVQRIATAVAALVGRPGASGNSKNLLVSGGPQQVAAPPSAGMQLFVMQYLRHAAPPYISYTNHVRH